MPNNYKDKKARQRKNRTERCSFVREAAQSVLEMITAMPGLDLQHYTFEVAVINAPDYNCKFMPMYGLLAEHCCK